MLPLVKQQLQWSLILLTSTMLEQFWRAFSSVRCPFNCHGHFYWLKPISGLYSGIFAMYVRYHGSKEESNNPKQKVVFYTLCVLYVLSVAVNAFDIAIFVTTVFVSKNQYLKLQPNQLCRMMMSIWSTAFILLRPQYSVAATLSPNLSLYA